ncbi:MULTISPECIES: class D sortase [Paenibacillus]|uniref:class D sortase n=1 Tax=Paenibacillus TaxID=44249 RepID=UPI002FE062B5
MRKWPYLLIIAGLILIAAPYAIEWNANREEKKLLQEAEALQRLRDTGGPNSELAAGYERVSRLLEQDHGEEEAPPPVAKETVKEGTLATIEIEKIDLKLPVLEGATQKNMKHAAAHMMETVPFGQVGNAAVAAHRARTKGRLFNRLNEVEIGDKIRISTMDGTYEYTVYDTSVVEPTDLSVLEGNGQDKILTLITCHPLKNPTHRLIIQARIES